MKKSMILKRVLIGFGVFLIVALSFGMFFYEKASAGMRNAELSSNTFLSKTSRGEYESSYSMMALTVQRQISYGEFRNSVTYPKGIFSDITTVKLTGYNFMYYIGDGMNVSVTGYVVYEDGNTGDLTASFIEENGEWKIYAMRINPNIDRLKKFSQDEELSDSSQ